ncbi:MAG: hypothetical protein SGCHY_004151, partial [Lobulomycetales sp.]
MKETQNQDAAKHGQRRVSDVEALLTAMTVKKAPMKTSRAGTPAPIPSSLDNCRRRSSVSSSGKNASSESLPQLDVLFESGTTHSKPMTALKERGQISRRNSVSEKDGGPISRRNSVTERGLPSKSNHSSKVSLQKEPVKSLPPGMQKDAISSPEKLEGRISRRNSITEGKQKATYDPKKSKPTKLPKGNDGQNFSEFKSVLSTPACFPTPSLTKDIKALSSAARSPLSDLEDE